ncbi:MAG: NADH-quinone oxidoreductase subunit C [Verrucomicrobiota bacterium]
MSLAPSEAAAALREKYADQVVEVIEFRGEVAVELKPEALQAAATFLRDDAGYDLPVDAMAVDFEDTEPRFLVLWELMSTKLAANIRLRVRTTEDEEEVPTLSHLYPGMEWMEREVYDMSGVRFTGHPDLRRILMWPGYPFHPLRKEFPLEGKSSEEPGFAFSNPAPLEGGPFHAAPSAEHAHEREPRSNAPKLD